MVLLCWRHTHDHTTACFVSDVKKQCRVVSPIQSRYCIGLWEVGNGAMDAMFGQGSAISPVCTRVASPPIHWWVSCRGVTGSPNSIDVLNVLFMVDTCWYYGSCWSIDLSCCHNSEVDQPFLSRSPGLESWSAGTKRIQTHLLQHWIRPMAAGPSHSQPTAGFP